MMVGLDTNVLVRYIMQDDAVQSAKATALIESLDADNPGYVTVVSVVELYWVLTSCYERSNEDFQQVMQVLLQTRQMVVETADQVQRALRVFAHGKADFADCLIERAAAGAGCERTMTFDVKASKHAAMTLIG